MVRAGIAALAPLSCAAAATQTAAQAGEDPSLWPLSVTSGGQTLTLYTPQLDAWDGHELKARMAVGVASAAATAPQTRYGIVEVEATTMTDKGGRTVTIENARVTNATFPSATAQEVAAWQKAIAGDFAGKQRRVPLDQFESQLALTGAAAATAQAPLRNDPPRVIFSQTPAMLIYIDGAPVYREFEGKTYQRVINTRPLLLRDQKGAHFLKIFDGWVSATALEGTWTAVGEPSRALESAFKSAMDQHLVDPLTGKTSDDEPAPSLRTNAPVIRVATAPTELIVTSGAPDYVPIPGTTLLYVKNTTGNVFRDTRDNNLFVLASGRWFRASAEAGPWTFVPANALPPDFAHIPDESPKENVKASVASTAQAREAAIAAGIPHTASVQVTGTTMDAPRLDGAPNFRPIDGTSLQYVVNSPTPIIRADATNLYAMQNGVWFHSSAVQGPWTVALSVPAELYRIPPTSPLYYVTFVRIYGAGAGVVYEGYTSGYSGTYVDPLTAVVVYGTGYSYDPWTGTVWYGAPVTYGYGASVSYTPWTGWAVAFGFGWFWGATTAAVGWGWGPYPYWGPWVYPAWGAAYGAYGGAVAWGPGGWAGYTGDIYSQWGSRATVSRAAGGYDAWTGNAWSTQVSRSYNSRTGVSSAGQRAAVQNVYTGNFAAGGRGVATGPEGNVVVGRGGIAGNAATGSYIAGGQGAFYNKDTGEWTTFGAHTGDQGGHVAHVGDNVYAGKDGNVYRHTDSGGWEQHTSGGWQSVPGNAQGEATRNASGGLGASSQTPRELPRDTGATLDRERQGRELGAGRYQNMRDSSAGLSRSFAGRRPRIR